MQTGRVVVAAAVLAACGGKKQAEPEPEPVAVKAVQGANEFMAIARQMHAGLPAPAALAETPCPPEISAKSDGASVSLWMFDRDIVEVFATDGASYKKRGLEPSQTRPGYETFLRDPELDGLRSKWFGGPEARARMTQLDGAAVLITVQPDGSLFRRAHVGVVLPVEVKQPELSGGDKFTPGKIDAWIVVWDVAAKKHLCATRVTSSNSETISYQDYNNTANPLAVLVGDLERTYYAAAQTALQKIAPGVEIYGPQRAATSH
jgi:hypothetical protein